MLLENDPDLQYLNEINERYGAKEFLVLTYSPKDKMISENSIKNLFKEIKKILLKKLNLLKKLENILKRVKNYQV